MPETPFGDFRSRGGASFATGGADYERLRPGYPDEAVAWLLADVAGSARVADVGAGTGKLTDALVHRGLDVVAVDPSADMLAQLRRRRPTVRVQVGTGEATGLDDQSVELVTFAQSWHWVEPGAGATELRRVLTPSGTAAMIWSFLDVRVDWVAELAGIWHSLAGEEEVAATRHRPDLGPDFGPVETITVDWTDPMAVPDLAELVTTRSYYLTASAAEQDEIRARVAELLARRWPGAEAVGLPYRTHAYRARRR